MPFFFRSEETHSTRIDQNLCTKGFQVLGVYTRHSLLSFFLRFYMSLSPLQSLLLSIALSQPLVHSLTHTQSYTCMCSFIFCGFSPVRSDDAFVLVLRFCCMNRKIGHSMAGKCRCAEHRCGSFLPMSSSFATLFLQAPRPPDPRIYLFNTLTLGVPSTHSYVRRVFLLK